MEALLALARPYGQTRTEELSSWRFLTEGKPSLAKPDPKREARGSGDKPILRFVLPAEILQSNQIAERLIKIPIPREPARRYGFRLRVQVSFDTRSEREAAVIVMCLLYLIIFIKRYVILRIVLRTAEQKLV